MDQGVFWIYTVVCKPVMIEINTNLNIQYQKEVAADFNFITQNDCMVHSHFYFWKTGSIKKLRADPSVKIAYFALWSTKKYMWMQNFCLHSFYRQKDESSASAFKMNQAIFWKFFDGNNLDKTSDYWSSTSSLSMHMVNRCLSNCSSRSAGKHGLTDFHQKHKSVSENTR